MQAPLLHKLKDQNFWLSSQRVLFWEEQKILIVSDLHVGKTGHFRKAGIAVPQTVLKEDLQRLFHLVQFFKATQLLVVGDLFHSHHNSELDLFKRWRGDLSFVQVKLVMGNHDILKREWYAEAGIEVVEKEMTLNEFCFTHDRCYPEKNEYTFCGHIHPGVVLNGLGRQTLRFPCFYFTPSFCILPAFGKFTGLATIKPTSSDVVYAIVQNSIIQLQ